MTIAKRWVVLPEAPRELLAGYSGMSRTIAQVLYNRGFTTPQDAARFLMTRSLAEQDYDFRLLEDIHKAISRIRQAIKSNERILVYGDFDADGVTSTALMVTGLRALGADVEAYIPHRVDEGYGLNSEALRDAAGEGYKLVITVDCGIRSIDEALEARRLGLDLIITDHHSLGPELPDAFAVVNCKRGGYPSDMLAGVGVAYKLVEALEKVGRANGGRRHQPVDLESLLDLVAIGTVADIMPLNQLENRVLVRRGLEVINRGGRPGLKALLDVSGVMLGTVDTGTIGFAIGPRINAAGRLDSAMIAYKLLVEPDFNEAAKLAQRLQDLNVLRQEITRAAQEKIREKMEGEDTDGALIFASDPSFMPGIVGLVAGRLTEEYFLPAVILEEGDTESRASCRSIPQFDITAALDECADLLVRHGGHALAAGFTVENKNIPALRERLTGIARERLHGQSLAPTLEIDATVDIHALNEKLHEELTQLEPTGSGNRQPTFAVQGVTITEARTVGRDDRHLKLKIARAGQPALDAIGFGLGEWASQVNGTQVDLAFQLEMNEWNGRSSLQLRLLDVRLTER
jgi:single-stranded-DNA-specific exonuclease